MQPSETLYEQQKKLKAKMLFDKKIFFIIISLCITLLVSLLPVLCLWASKKFHG